MSLEGEKNAREVLVYALDDQLISEEEFVPLTYCDRFESLMSLRAEYETYAQNGLYGQCLLTYLL